MGIVGSQATTNQKSPAPPLRPATAPRAQQAPPQQQKASTKLTGGGFAGAKKPGNNGSFLLPKEDGSAASYDVKINRCFLKAANQADYDARPDLYKEVSFKGLETAVIEGVVVNSDNPRCPHGYVFSWVSVDGKYDYHLTDVKGFICAVAGTDDHTKVDDDDLVQVFGMPIEGAAEGAGEAALGKVLHVTVKNKGTRTGGDFGLHLWSPLLEEAQGAA